MKVSIKYFGLIAELTGKTEEQIDFSGSSASDLKDWLSRNYPGLTDQNFQLAQNNEIINEQTRITGPEIALLPPFAGG